MAITIYQPAPIPIDEEERERAVAVSGALTVRNDVVLQDLVEEARRRLATTVAAISILSHDWQYVIAGSGLSPGPYGRKTSMCGHAIMARRDVFHVGDVRADQRFAGNPMVCDAPHLRFYAAAPLMADGDMAIGTLCVYDGEPRDILDPYDRMQLQSLSLAVVSRLEALRAPSLATLVVTPAPPRDGGG